MTSAPALARICRVIFAALLFAVVAPSPAASQASNANASIELVDQTDWVTGGAPFSIAIRVNGEVVADQTELVVTVFEAVPNRSQFQQTLQDRGYGTSVILERRSIDEVRGPDGIARIDLPVQDPKQRRYFLRNNGVYPVKVELRATGTAQPIDIFTTHLINIPNPPQTNKLAIAPVIPVRSPYTDIATDPLGIPDSGESIRAVSTMLRQFPTTPFSLAVSPETIDRANENASANAAMQELIAARTTQPIVSAPWVPLSSPMFTPEMASERNRQFDRGTKVLTERFGAVSSETAVSTGQIDPLAIPVYRERGAKRMVVTESSLAQQVRDTTLARPFGLSTGRNSATMPAVQLDDKLGAHFGDPEGPALGAHRLLADLAVIYNDRPGQERGVALTAPNDWTPNSAFLLPFARGLATSPIHNVSTLETLFELPPEGGGRTGTARQLASRAKSVTSDFGTDKINDIRKRIDGYTTIVDPENKNLDYIERRLLAAESASLDTKTRDAALDSTDEAIDKQLNAIRLPSERSIRFTARQGEIPVSIQNDTGSPVNVVVKLSSDKVLFPTGSDRSLEVERTQVTERFSVDARTSGVYPVQVRLESPDGSLVLARSRILISSTATSGVGVLLSVGAGAFLAIWWLRSTIKNRRAKHA